ncbi:uncharacterized protein TrAtP1_008105 [Trichoderma atroviride]|uniref:uncharacterized protein n=1 Tax=Hypocrea atroviridis TaxID=63577 RepID=UPI00332EFA5B|nr:hypothetical protein TrAtP1_008105 [Trichoderma atroviride]
MGAVYHPWAEDARHSPWKLRLFNLERGCRGLPSGNEFETMRNLLLSWENTRKEGAVGERSRYVILLEDLNPRIAELLGVLLEIPPEFFLSHCIGSNTLSVVDKQLSKGGSSKYWKAAVPQNRTLPRETKLGRNGSWIAVIITDPHPSRLLLFPASSPDDPKTIHLKTHEPPYKSQYREIVLDSTNDDFTQPHERSIFDAVAEAYENIPPKSDDDPFSATYIVRNRIRALWEQDIFWDQRVIYETVYRNVWSHQISQSSPASENFENRIAINNQAMTEYQQLMRRQQIIRNNRHSIRAIIHNFRLSDTYYSPEKTSKHGDYKNEEIESWKFLDEKLQYAEESLKDHMMMYSTRSTMEETYEAKMQSWESMKQTKEANRQTAAANRMARSSGQLTKIATIIVPCTFVASIFSMGGDFAAGESLFYVYWIISVPITVGLLTWILHEDIADVVDKSKRWMNSRRTKLSEKSEV